MLFQKPQSEKYNRVPVLSGQYCFNDPNVPPPDWAPVPIRGILHAFELHIHPEIEIHVILRGEIRVKIGAETLTLHPGDVMIVNPYEPHSGSVACDAVAEYAHIVADLEYFRRCCGSEVDLHLKQLISGERSFRHFIPAGTDIAQRVSEQILQIIEAHRIIETRPCFADCTLTGSVFLLLGLLFDEWPPDVSEPGSQKSRSFISEVLEFVSAHSTEDVSTADAASVLGYNRNYFCSLFRRCFGVTFIEYLNEYRIIKATELFADESLSMAAIAEKTGFASYSYFCRSFKKHTGISPSEYFRS